MRTLLCLIALCGLSYAAGPFVRAGGKQLVTPDGKPLLLRGINLGNWMVPEGYMFKLDKGAASAREIERLFNELVGPEEAGRFWREYRERYITADDIDLIRRAGFNSVRVPLHYKFFVENGEGFALVDRLIEWCRKAGIYVILDMHAAPGGQTGTNIDDSWGFPWLFDSPEMEKLAVDVWTRIAKRYANEPVVIGYDLLNEPIPPFKELRKYDDRLEPMLRKLSAAVRSVDQNHVLVLEGKHWASTFEGFGEPFDKNALYSFHKYWSATDRSVIQSYLDFRERHNVPLWLGESGENTDEWIQKFAGLLEENQIGWCFWPYKKMAATSSPVSFDTPVNWDAIAAYSEVQGTSGATEKKLPKRPTVEEARAALNDLLDKIRLARCRVNSGYFKALGVSVPSLDTGKKIVSFLPGPQEWINTPVSWKADGSSLTIVSGKKTNYYISPAGDAGGSKDANAPMLVFRPDDGDFILTAKLSNELPKQWDAAMLMAYVDENNWAKFALEKSVYQEPTVVTVVTRGVSDDCNSVVIDGNSVWYRMARLGKALGYYYSIDGKKWKMVRAFTLGDSPNLRVGLGSQSPVGPGSTAIFSEVSYKVGSIKDIFAGE